MTAPPIAALAPTHRLALGGCEVEICWATLDVAPDRLAALHATLPASDRRESERQRCEPKRFVAARGLVREILGRRIGEDPARLEIGRTAAGKPFLGNGAARLRFNVSHASEWLLVAMTLDSEVGADVERLRADVDCAALARHLFGPGEMAALVAATPAERRRAFFACWARKEACLKAIGTGFAIAPDRIDAGMDMAPTVVRFADADWCVRGIPAPRPDLVAAIAVRA